MRLVRIWADWRLDAIGHRYTLRRLMDGLAFEYTAATDAGALDDASYIVAKTEQQTTIEVNP